MPNGRLGEKKSVLKTGRIDWREAENRSRWNNRSALIPFRDNTFTGGISFLENTDRVEAFETIKKYFQKFIKDAGTAEKCLHIKNG